MLSQHRRSGCTRPPGYCRVGIGGNGGCKSRVGDCNDGIGGLIITAYLCLAIATMGRPCTTFGLLLYSTLGTWQTGTQYQSKTIFVPLLLRGKEHPMLNWHTRSLIDTMKSLSSGARTLKPLRILSNRWSHWHHFIRLVPLIVRIYCGMSVL